MVGLTMWVDTDFDTALHQSHRTCSDENLKGGRLAKRGLWIWHTTWISVGWDAGTLFEKRYYNTKLITSYIKNYYFHDSGNNDVIFYNLAISKKYLATPEDDDSILKDFIQPYHLAIRIRPLLSRGFRRQRLHDCWLADELEEMQVRGSCQCAAP